MDHHAVADIDANVRRTNGVVSFFKEDQVTRLCICRRNIAALASQSIRCRAPDVPAIAAVIDDPADKTGAVKTGAWGTAAPHIRHSQILFGFCDHPCKLFIRQGFFWNVILETTAGASACSTRTTRANAACCAATVCRGACAKQFWAIAISQIVGIIPPSLLPIHVLSGNGVKALIFQ